MAETQDSFAFIRHIETTETDALGRRLYRREIEEHDGDWIPTSAAMKILRCKRRSTVHSYYDTGKLKKRIERNRGFFLYSADECREFMKQREKNGD